MPKIINEYKMEGDYLYQNVLGSHSGTVTLCSDGKLLGDTVDNNGQNPDNSRKLLLGLYSPKRKSIEFLKISPGLGRGDDLVAILWSASSKESVTESSGLASSYGGFWLRADGVPTLDRIEEDLMEGMPSVDKLMDLDADTLRELYFPRDIIAGYESVARGANQTGVINFAPLRLPSRRV